MRTHAGPEGCENPGARILSVGPLSHVPPSVPHHVSTPSPDGSKGDGRYDQLSSWVTPVQRAVRSRPPVKHASDAVLCTPIPRAFAEYTRLTGCRGTLFSLSSPQYSSPLTKLARLRPPAALLWLVPDRGPRHHLCMSRTHLALLHRVVRSSWCMESGRRVEWQRQVLILHFAFETPASRKLCVHSSLHSVSRLSRTPARSYILPLCRRCPHHQLDLASIRLHLLSLTHQSIQPKIVSVHNQRPDCSTLGWGRPASFPRRSQPSKKLNASGSRSSNTVPSQVS
jgi:hypothetical protein